jgi:uncharacterized membrane protein SpoIIM required for sporulation
MFEQIISPKTTKKKPWEMVFLGVILVSVSIWFGFFLSWFIDASASMLVIAILVITLAPLMHKILVMEYLTDELIAEHKLNESFFIRHIDVIATYSFLFLGLLIGFTLWFTILPEQSTAMAMPTIYDVFSEPLSAYSQLSAQISGKSVEGLVGKVLPGNEKCMTYLTRNNLRIMLYCFVASFLFGAGALWLLIWNASVISVAIGLKIRELLTSTGIVKAYIIGFSTHTLGIALWAIPELTAYFVAAVAGGIISVAVSRHHLKSKEFWFTVYDAGLLLILAVCLVLLGAYIEHFFVPAGIC